MRLEIINDFLRAHLISMINTLIESLEMVGVKVGVIIKKSLIKK